MNVQKTLVGAMLVTATMVLSQGTASAAGGTCGLPSSGSWLMIDGSDQIGAVRLGETPSGLIMDGSVDGAQISYRMQACRDEGTGMMVPNHGTEGPPELFLQSVSEVDVNVWFKDPDGRDVQLRLVMDPNQ